MIRLLWPCNRSQVVITDSYQDHKHRPGYKGSLANDLASLGGIKLPMYAEQHNGKVIESHFDATGYGNEIIIEYPDIGIKVQYGHLDSRASFTNSKVNAGELVGIMGTTGSSTGIHCHWAVWKKVNNTWANIDPLDPANGIVMVNTVAELDKEVVMPPTGWKLPTFPTLPQGFIVVDVLMVRSKPDRSTPTSRTSLKRNTAVLAYDSATDAAGNIWLCIGFEQWICGYYQGQVYVQFGGM